MKTENLEVGMIFKSEKHSQFLYEKIFMLTENDVYYFYIYDYRDSLTYQFKTKMGCINKLKEHYFIEDKKPLTEVPPRKIDGKKVNFNWEKGIWE